MTLKEKLDFDLHNGEEIDDFIRNNTYYIRFNDDDSQTILFENGNQYKLNSQGEVLEGINAQDELFIDRQLTKAIKEYLDSNTLLTRNYFYKSINYNDQIEFNLISKDEKKQRSVLIKVIIDRNSKCISIPNIMIPFELKHNGFGKEILNRIFKIAEEKEYALYLVQLVDSFYNRMVKRGAKIIEPYDILEITENTRLK